MKLKIGDKLEIHWIDAFTQSGWWDEEEIKEKLKDRESCPTISFGILAYWNKNWLVISLSDSNPKNNDLVRWGYWKAIPRKWVKKIKVYKK